MSNVSGASTAALQGGGGSSSRVYFHVHGLPTIYKLKINKDSQLKHLFRHIPTQRYTPPTASGPPVFTFNGDELDPLKTPEYYGMPQGESNHNKVEVHFPMENRAQRSPLVTREMLVEAESSRNTVHESSLRKTEEMEKSKAEKEITATRTSSTPHPTGNNNDSLREVAQEADQPQPLQEKSSTKRGGDNRGDDIERASSYLGRPGSPERARTLQDSELAYRPYRTKGGEPPANETSSTILDASAIRHGDGEDHHRTGTRATTSSGHDGTIPDYEELGFRVKKLSNDLQQERNDNVDLQREIERLETGKEILEQQLRRSRAEAAANSDAAERLSQTRHELDQVRTDLTSLEVKHDSLLGRYERLKNEHEALRQQQLNNDVEVMEREQRMASIQAEARMEEAKNLKEELAKLESHFSEKAANYERQLEARDQLVRTAKTDAREALESQEELHKQVNLYDRQLKDVTRERDMLKKETDSLQDQNMSLINDSATASQNVIKSQAELRASNTKIVTLTAEIDKLETELKTVRHTSTAAEKLQTELSDQNKRVDSLLEEKRSLEGLISQQQADLDAQHRDQQDRAASNSAETEKMKVASRELEDLRQEKEEVLGFLKQKEQELNQVILDRDALEADYNLLKTHAEQGFRFLEDKVADEEAARKDAERCLLECNEALSELQSENSHLKRLLKEQGVTTYSTAGRSQATVQQPEVAIRNSNNTSVRFVDPQPQYPQSRNGFSNGNSPSASSSSRYAPLPSQESSRGEYQKPSRTPGRPLYQHPSPSSSQDEHAYEESSDLGDENHHHTLSTYPSSRDGLYGPGTPAQNQHPRHRSPSASHPPPRQQHPSSYGGSSYPSEEVPPHTTVGRNGAPPPPQQQQPHQQRSSSIGVRDVTVITGSPGPSHRSASGGYSGPSQPADRPTPAPGLNRGGPQQERPSRDSSTRRNQGPTQAQDGSAPPPPVRSLR